MHFNADAFCSSTHSSVSLCQTDRVTTTKITTFRGVQVDAGVEMGLMTSYMRTTMARYVQMRNRRPWDWTAWLHTYIYLEHWVPWTRTARCGASSMQHCAPPITTCQNYRHYPDKMTFNTLFMKLPWGFRSQQRTCVQHVSLLSDDESHPTHHRRLLLSSITTISIHAASRTMQHHSPH